MPGTMSTEDLLRASYPVRVEEFSHAGTKFEILLPDSAEALIDEAAFEADERLPYWADLWPSAVALARHLCDVPLPAGRVLELGCGVGLPSLVLLGRGADVLASDYYVEALRFAVANAERKGLLPLRTALLDWRDIPLHLGVFDLVLIADALYELRNAENLARALPELVAPAGRVLLADPGRAYLSEFRRRMQAAGWRLSELERREEVSDPASGATSSVLILEARRDG
jgi:predicted nicotinamide N-methyase